MSNWKARQANAWFLAANLMSIGFFAASGMWLLVLQQVFFAICSVKGVVRHE